MSNEATGLDRILPTQGEEAERIVSQLAALAADGFDTRRMIAHARAELGRSAGLRECSKATILQALADAARAGLTLRGGEAYILPYRRRYKDDRGNWASRMEAQLIPGWRGLLRIAYDAGALVVGDTGIVREGDEWSLVVGDDGATFRHVPQPWGDPNRKILGAYAYARLTTGGTLVEAMSFAEIEAVRARSKASDNGPWVTDWPEMARKTPLRRLLKRVPLSDAGRARMLAAESLDEITIDAPDETPRARPAAPPWEAVFESEPDAGLGALLALLPAEAADLARELALCEPERHVDALAELPDASRMEYVRSVILAGR